MFLRTFMGMVFLAAALYRILYPSLIPKEMKYLNLPENNRLIPTCYIIGELAIAIILLCNIQLKIAYQLTIGFLIGAMYLVFCNNYKLVIESIPDVFIIYPSFTDLILHITYVIILIHLMMQIDN